VKSYGLKVHEDRLLVLVTKNGGEVHSLQFIEPNGEKRFLPGSSVAGGYYVIGTRDQAERDKLFCVCEGYATGASIHEATGYTVVVAFSASNLLPVVQSLHKRFLDWRVILCADDDAATKGNPGLTKGTAAAQAIDGLLAVPDFGAVRPAGATDFNDMAAHCGLEAVKIAIGNARSPAPKTQQIEADKEREVTPAESAPVEKKANGAASVDEDAMPKTQRATRRKGAIVLDTTGKTPVANLSNAVRILEQDRSLHGLVCFDEFLGKLMTGNPSREWTDADDLTLTLHIQRECGIPRLGREIASQAALTVGFRNVRNCVRDWLESLKWDGEPRIEHFFEDHFGATGTAYTRSASKNFWLSMVARIYRPGCQADNMIVLEGPQGIKKSSALRVIGGQWFAEQHENVTGRSFFEVLQGKLLVEISEMDAFSRAEVTRVKQVITNTSDRFREPYGRHAKDHPRQCIFAGTTNKDDWNRDETGARRFWPITCQGDIDLGGIVANREQFFAEAVQRFKAGESWWEMPAEQTRQQQAARYVAPAWVELIEKYIEQERMIEDGNPRWVPRAEPLPEVSVAEILQNALDIPEAQWNKASEMRVAESLRFLGWIKKDVRRKGRIVKRWFVSLPEGGNGDESSNG
jgi:putative DNA primase/helicase